MWERYGFYVVQTLLALYLAHYFQWGDTHVYALVGSFTALTYISPLLGGWIADHLIGQKRAIFTGAMVLFLSYSCLIILHSKAGLSICLAGIAVGTGLLKPNISSLLGNEYPENSSMRERGFTIFYMGITTGIILGTTLPSYLQSHYGWSYAFGSGAIGMLIAITVFYWGTQRFQIKDYHPCNCGIKEIFKAFCILIGLWITCYYILHYPRLADTIFTSIIVLSVGYLLQTAQQETAEQRRQTLVIGLLCLISIMFWAFYFQMFMSLTLFISRAVEPTLWGIPFYPPYYVGIQSIGIILFGLFLGRQKQQMSKIEKGIQVGNKFLLAMIFMTLAYGAITFVCYTSDVTSLLSPLAFIPIYLLISMAELLLSPAGLSAITFLASRKKVSTMMGIFFVSLGVGGHLSGKLANIAAIPSGESSLLIVRTHYTHAFTYLFLMLIVTSLVCMAINLCIHRLMLKNKTE